MRSANSLIPCLKGLICGEEGGNCCGALSWVPIPLVMSGCEPLCGVEGIPSTGGASVSCDILLGVDDIPLGVDDILLGCVIVGWWERRRGGNN